MRNIFKIKEVQVDNEGLLVETQGPIMEETNTIKLEMKASPHPEEIMANYIAMDEDDLFDYEKIVIPFTREHPATYSYINLAIIVENGKISIEEFNGGTRRNSFENFFSKAEFEIAVESQVHLLDSNDTEQLNWIQMQQPGLYKTPSGIYTVFKDKQGRMNFMLEGRTEVWLSPANINEKAELNEELSKVVPEKPIVANQDAIEALRNSEAFQRMRAALNNR